MYRTAFRFAFAFVACLLQTEVYAASITVSSMPDPKLWVIDSSPTSAVYDAVTVGNTLFIGG